MEVNDPTKGDPQEEVEASANQELQKTDRWTQVLQGLQGADPRPNRGKTMADVFSRERATGPGPQEYTFDLHKYEPYIGSGAGYAAEDVQDAMAGGASTMRKRRSENQGWMASMGHAGLKTVGGTMLALGEQAGYLADVGDHMHSLKAAGNFFADLLGKEEDAFEVDEEHEYGNKFTRAIAETKREMNQRLPLYKENPQQTFALGDFQWWLQHGTDLTESVAAFLATGAGVGMALKGGAKMLSRGLALGAKPTSFRGGAKLHNLLQEGAHGLTSYNLAHVEGAMEAAQVYENVYDQAFKKGLREGLQGDEAREFAKEMASRSAAVTGRTNLLNTALNYTAVSPLFRSMGTAKQFQKFGLSKKAGESTAQWLKRLKDNPETRSFAKKHLGRIAAESGQESLEELVNEISVFEGEYFADRQLGEHDESLSFGDRVMSVLGEQETWLAMGLGAIGGAGQHAIMSHVPFHKKRTTDEDGNPTHERVSAYTLEKQAFLEGQHKMREQLIDRIERFQKAEADLREAAEKGDQYAYEDAQNRLFRLASHDAIVNGTEEQVIKMYEEIAALSPEEAQEKGYDEDYKEKAEQRIKDIRQLTQDWEDHYRQFSYSNEEDLARLPEAVFRYHIAKHNAKKQVEFFEAEARSTEQEVRDNMADRGTDLDRQEMAIRFAKMKGYEGAIDALNSDLERVDEVFDESKSARDQLRERYGVPRMRNRTQTKAEIKRQIQKEKEALQELQDEFDSEVERVKEQREGAEDLSREKLEGIVMAQAAQNSRDQERLQAVYRNLKSAQRQLENYTKAYDRITSTKGRKEFVEAVLKENQEQAKKAEDRIIERINQASTIGELEAAVPDIDAFGERVQNAYVKRRNRLDTKEKKKSKGREETTQTEEVASEPEEDAEVEAGPTPSGPNATTDFGSGETVVETEEDEGDDSDPDEGGTPAGDPNQPSPDSGPSGADATVTGGTEGRDATREWDVDLVGVDDYINKIRKADTEGEVNQIVELAFHDSSPIHPDSKDGKRILEAANQRVDEIRKEEAAEDAAIDSLPEEGEERENVVNPAHGDPKQLEENNDEAANPQGKETSPTTGSTMRKGKVTVKAAETIVAISFEPQKGREGQFENSSNRRRKDFDGRVESPEWVQPGDRIAIEIDWAYVEENDIDVSADNVGEIPYKVTLLGDTDSFEIGYIRTESWVAERGAVAEGPNGNNRKVQTETIRAIRQTLFERIVRGQDDYVETVITDKGIGHLSKIYSFNPDGTIERDENGDPVLEMRPISEAAGNPDDVELFVYRQGERQTAKGRPTNKDLINNDRDVDFESREGQVGIIIPTPVKDKYFAATAWVPKLSEGQAETVYQLIRAFRMSPEKPLKANLQKALRDRPNSIDFSKENKGSLIAALEEFIQIQYFDESDITSMSHPAIDVTPGTGTVKIYDPNEGVIYTTAPNSKEAENNPGLYKNFYHPSNKEKITKVLQNIFWNLDMDRMGGLVESGFTTIQINPDESIERQEHESYDSYAKSNIQTYINGLDTYEGRDGNEHSLFFEKPSLEFDSSFEEETDGGVADESVVRGEGQVAEEPSEEESREEETQEEKAKKDQQEFQDELENDDLFGDNVSFRLPSSLETSGKENAEDYSEGELEAMNDELHDQAKITCKI